MGQDIHMVLEAKIKGEWIGLCSPDHLPVLINDKHETSWRHGFWPACSGRWYLLWYYMCGAGRWSVSMRQEKYGLPLFEPRGFPPDPSPLSHFYLIDDDYGRDEYHHASWLTLDEFMMCYQLTRDMLHRDQPDEFPDKQWSVWDVIGDAYGGVRYYTQDFRFVFAFDN